MSLKKIFASKIILKRRLTLSYVEQNQHFIAILSRIYSLKIPTSGI